jgi:hypothetical protein
MGNVEWVVQIIDNYFTKRIGNEIAKLIYDSHFVINHGRWINNIRERIFGKFQSAVKNSNWPKLGTQIYDIIKLINQVYL